jgi:6,7-dimethyl-8-ribityllumazine synthase
LKGPYPYDIPDFDRGLNIQGDLDGTGLKIGIVVAKFNLFITSKLLRAAFETLIQHGITEEDVVISWVPGAFEIPLAASAMAETGSFDAIVCLGAVIKGETAHFHYVAGEAARGIATASIDTGVPITFGVLTTDSEDQAMDRSGGRFGNKGSDVALAAIEMVNLLEEINNLGN